MSEHVAQANALIYQIEKEFHIIKAEMDAEYLSLFGRTPEEDFRRDTWIFGIWLAFCAVSFGSIIVAAIIG